MLESGSILEGRYVVQDLIGRGGMGRVYLGHLRTLESKQVAIKVVRSRFDTPAEEQRALEHFRREASLMAGLDHPNMVHINDFFTVGDTAYLVMDYVDGITLDHLLKGLNEFIELPLAISLIGQLCDVLEYFHQQDPPVVFRDMKPANVMIARAGKPKLIDFGIARTLEPESMTASFLKGTGTHGYAPIEQYMPGAHTDVTSDIYALGATMYSIFTRQTPPAAVELVTGQATLTPPETINPALPPRLGLLIAKMMQMQKADRCQTIDEVRTHLAQVFTADAPGVAVTAPVAAEPGPARRRFCPDCGYEGLPGDVVCDSCGARFGRRGQQLHTWKPSKPPRAKGDKATPLKVAPPKPLPVPAVVTAAPEEPVPVNFVPAVPAALMSEAPRIQGVVQVAPSQLLGFLAVTPDYVGVRVTDIDARGVAFLSDEAYKAGTSLLMKLAVPLLAVGNSIVVEVRITVESSSPDPGGSCLHQAKFKDLPARLKPILDGVLSQERREARRFKRAFQVVSKELPGYRAISTDVSASGIGVLAAGGLPVGTPIEMWLDLDDTPTPGDKPARRIVHARVVHTAPQIDGRHRVGARFEGMSETVASALYAYLKRTTR